MKTVAIRLAVAELALLSEALGSHKYWQLSDQQYRSSGEVLDPGSDDEGSAAEIADCDALDEKLSAARKVLDRPAKKKASKEGR